MPTTFRARAVRALAPMVFVVSVLLPAAAPAPAAAAGPVILRVGTLQPIGASNPWNAIFFSDYEAFQLTYNLLVDFGPNAEPAPGFANSWTRSPDKVTFHIRTGMKWSDGQPATSKDACYSWGLALAASAAGDYVGSGYLDPTVTDAGVTKVECPDNSTFIAYTTDPSDRIFQTYVPIIPEHIWGKDDYKKMTNETFDPPLVGTGPYTMVEWNQQYARFVRNPYYWGTKGYEDEVIIQFFKDNVDGMAQALKTGEIDYARSLTADQINALKGNPLFTTVAGRSNGWSQLAFNTYGTGGSKPLKAGEGPSTKALLDPAFRDALGYAVDNKTLVDRVLEGYGELGSTIVPPVLSQWHVDPDHPRTFNIDLAKQKLDAAGYVLDGNNRRLDKEGKEITLRLYYPNTDSNYPKVAQFVQSWYGQLGINVVSQSMDESALADVIYPSSGAKYDIELWGWGGSPDPYALLQIFLCSAIDSTSDSQYCNPAYDALYKQQLTEVGDARKATLAKMQNLIYDEAPYDIIYYDDALHAYRNDKFAGWQNQPPDGTPFFTYGTLDYTLLTNAAAQPSPTAAAPSSAASAGASTAATSAPTSAPSATAAPADTGSASSSLPLPLIALVVVVLVIVVVALLLGRRRTSTAGEDE